MLPTQTRERYSLAAPAFYAAASLLLQIPASWFTPRSAAADSSQPATHNFFTRLLLNSNVLYAMITLGITFNLVWAAPPHLWVLLVISKRSYGLLGAAWMVACAVWALINYRLISQRHPAPGRYGESQPDDPGSS